MGWVLSYTTIKLRSTMQTHFRPASASHLCHSSTEVRTLAVFRYSPMHIRTSAIDAHAEVLHYMASGSMTVWPDSGRSGYELAMASKSVHHLFDLSGFDFVKATRV